MTFYAPAEWLVIGVLWPTLHEVVFVAWLGLVVVDAIIACVVAWRVARR